MKIILVSALFLSFIFAALIRAQETRMSLTIQPTSSITSGEETVFPVKSESHQFAPGVGGTFSFLSPGGGSVKIIFFIGTTQVTLDFFIDSYAESAVIATRPLPTGRDVVGSLVYDMRTFEGTATTLTFDNPFSMKVGYLDSQIENLDEESLNIYFWNETRNVWETFASSTLNTVDNTITIFTDHLTLFATLGEGKEEQPITTVTVPASAGGGGGGGGSVFQPAQTAPSGPTKEKPTITIEAEEVSTPKEAAAILSSKDGRQLRQVPKESKAVARQTEQEKIEKDSAPPALFDIEVQPDAEEQSRQWKPLFVIIIAGFVAIVTVAGVYILARRKIFNFQ